jgi:hypothetical protein
MTLHALEVVHLAAVAAIAQQGGARNARRCEIEPGQVDPDVDVDLDRLIESDQFWDDVLADDADTNGDDDEDDPAA